MLQLDVHKSFPERKKKKSLIRWNLTAESVEGLGGWVQAEIILTLMLKVFRYLHQQAQQRHRY